SRIVVICGPRRVNGLGCGIRASLSISLTSTGATIVRPPAPVTASGSPISWPRGLINSGLQAAWDAAGALPGAQWASTSQKNSKLYGQRQPNERSIYNYGNTFTVGSHAAAAGGY